jgi:hypothetical protein
MPNDGGLEDHEPSRSRRALRAVCSHVQPGSFPVFLVAGVVLYVLNGLAVDSMAGRIVVLGARVGVMCAGIYVLSAQRVTLWLGVLVTGLYLALEAPLWGFDPWVTRVLVDAMAMAFLLWILVVVLQEVFRPTTTELNALIGVLCGFVLILMVFMRLHTLLEACDPGSYQANALPLSARSDVMLVASSSTSAPSP